MISVKVCARLGRSAEGTMLWVEGLLRREGRSEKGG